MAAKLPVALKKRIAALQTQLAAVEAEQRAARDAARAFVREAMTRLGLSVDDLIGGPAPRRSGRRGRPAKAGAGVARKARRRRGTRTAGATKPATRGTSPARRPKTAAGTRRGSAGVKVSPKYRGPAGDLWSGRGKQPRWLAALVAEGRSPQEFLIG